MDVGYIWADYILGVVCVYTKTRVSRVKVVYKPGKAECGAILKSGDISDESLIRDNDQSIA